MKFRHLMKKREKAPIKNRIFFVHLQIENRSFDLMQNKTESRISLVSKSLLV
jgi:hypothetical protein